MDLIRLHLLNDADQICGVGQIAVAQVKARVDLVRVSVDSVHALSVEQRAKSLNPVNGVTLTRERAQTRQ